MTNIYFLDMVNQPDQTSDGRETVDFNALFRPKTLAVIGVSLTHDRHPANVIYYKNNLRQKVKVFPVNARGGVLQGEPVYPRVSEIPETVDLAVVATRAEQVPGILVECIEAKVRGAVVVSGGFSESGRKDLQDRIVSIAKEAELSLCRSQLPGFLFSPLCGYFLYSERTDRQAGEGQGGSDQPERWDFG